MNTLEKVRQLVAEQLCIPVEDVKEDSDIVELGADSIDVVELLTTLEDQLNITIPESKVEGLRTVASIVKLIDETKK